MSYEHIPEDEFREILRKSNIAERFLESDMGKLMEETCNRLVEKVNFEQATCPMEEFLKPDNQLAWRMALKFYKYDFLTAIKQYAEQGFLVYQERKISESSSETEESLNTAEKGVDDGR